MSQWPMIRSYHCRKRVYLTSLLQNYSFYRQTPNLPGTWTILTHWRVRRPAQGLRQSVSPPPLKALRPQSSPARRTPQKTRRIVVVPRKASLIFLPRIAVLPIPSRKRRKRLRRPRSLPAPVAAASDPSRPEPTTAARRVPRRKAPTTKRKPRKNPNQK